MDAALFSLGDDGRTVEFSLENLDRVISGPEEAVQFVAVHFFTDPGSLLHAKDFGGGLLKLIDGRIIRRSELRIEGISATRRTLASILRYQSPDIDESARITNLEFIDLDIEGNTKIKMKVRITLAIGRSLAINLLAPGG
jgi:hypothetical protein